ncbi:MAG: gliding motility lipoprotein GldH [Tannerellaceae bacterium]|jgi:gliding motility-associated lipoprotein GldH|nr:gliding motility lipoprotein GldH [Tannerellaceae bacterium]
MSGIRIKGLLLAVIGCCLCLSCENRAIYDQYQVIENTLWEKDREYYFTFEVEDISVPYTITFEVRNNNLYPYQNLWIFFSEEKPVGPIQRDTLECMLADDAGKWYGHGISLYQSGFPVRTDYLFPHEGQYTFAFRQGMRNDALKGIQEIGLRVEKSGR